MFECVDKRFEELIEIASLNNLNLEIISKAYLKAKQLHGTQTRKDGTLYLTHPLEVAFILAKLGFDEDVIAGALLHDTIEDCAYSPEELKGDFNENIFRLVDCVSAIDKEYYQFDEENIFEDVEFIKASAEEQTFNKLISLGKKSPNGFAIKFADRIHNLTTIEAFAYPKQLEKIRETERWLLPIAKVLKSEYFYGTIKNECFKIANKSKIGGFLENYNSYHNSNQKYIDDLNERFEELFGNRKDLSVEIRAIKEYKIFEDLSSRYNEPDVSQISQKIENVENYNIFLIYESDSTKKEAEKDLSLIENNTNLKIVDYKICLLAKIKALLAVGDCKFNIFVVSKDEYKKAMLGNIEMCNLSKIDEDNIHQFDIRLIEIKTQSGDSVFIAKDSTVLDFAFKLDKNLGFGFKYAIINDSKTKIPPYTKLYDGDRVEIVADKDFKNNPKLRWLAYVNTELAKKTLIRWFEKNSK